MTRLLFMIAAAVSVFGTSPAGAQRYRGYGPPPCPPGKVRVWDGANGQCFYPGEARGGRGYRGRGYNRGYGRGGRVIGEGPSVGCPPGKVRISDGRGGQCH